MSIRSECSGAATTATGGTVPSSTTRPRLSGGSTKTSGGSSNRGGWRTPSCTRWPSGFPDRTAAVCDTGGPQLLGSR